jgi:hypothetical protein
MAIGSKIEKINHKIDEVKRPLFVGVFFIWHLLYFLVFFGVVYVDSTYIRDLSILIQGFIGVFLIMRFHPYRTYAINRFDAMVIFSSATFLMTNLLTTELLAPYLPGIEEYLKGKASNVLTIGSPKPTPSSMIGSRRIPSTTPMVTTAITSLPTDIHGENILLSQTY